MSVVLPALGVTVAALCVWLAVRIINRRERWAKRTAVVLVTVGLIVGAYATAYTNMVCTSLPDQWTNIGSLPYFGSWRIELVADYEGFDPVTLYSAGRDQAFWRKVFAPAHWIDRRIRREKWVIEQRDDRWPSTIDGPGWLEEDSPE